MQFLTLIIVVLVVSFECQNPVIAGPSNDIDDLVATGIDNIKKIVSLIPGIDSSVTETNASISTTV
uniref:Secreted protein n=1 Tax=Schistosoma mansoni TaxID=6183 RepID=A0A5K4F7I5_SCHMA